jgi:hypothetical protein
MTLSEAEKQLQERWLTLTEEERFLTCGGMYEAEKAILELVAPKHYSKSELHEFVFFHMHGMTIEECVNRVPDRIP